jgi:hypothetical protein
MGYQLLVIDSDSRMTITVVDPGGREWPLVYDEVISRNFTSLGQQAEWQVLDGSATKSTLLLTVKVEANEDPDSEKVTPYWAVARVSSAGSCVTARVDSGPNEAAQLAEARMAAATGPCLSARRP